jgi:hypothetical protein
MTGSVAPGATVVGVEETVALQGQDVIVVVFSTSVCVTEPDVIVVRISPFVEAVTVEFDWARTKERDARRPRRKKSGLGSCIFGIMKEVE